VTAAAPLLEVAGLEAGFETPAGWVRAVDGVSFRVGRGEIVGLVGESGCGKSATALALVGLLPRPAGRLRGGSVRLDGRELVDLPESELRRVRGRRVAMVFQDPLASLNPYLRVEEQLAEVARLHLGLGRRPARVRAEGLLAQVGLQDPGRCLRAFPHQLSGGMRQRVMIAMALLGEPDLLLADEPTTALDVTVQAQILELLRRIREERGMGILFVTHDLAVVAGLCDRVVVLYAGRVVEEAPTPDLFARPGHPYSAALLHCAPRLDARPGARLAAIPGQPPGLIGPLLGATCSFAPRCAQARAACLAGEPPLCEEPGGRRRRCVLPLERVA
jgi:oligopeptide transport system ATP-binding protein